MLAVLCRNIRVSFFLMGVLRADAAAIEISNHSPGSLNSRLAREKDSSTDLLALAKQF